jgi:predicted nucleic acid-binding protein
VRIVNASPLISLARVGLLELLSEPPDPEVIVPDVVFQEVLAGERFDANVAAIRLAASDWIRVTPAANVAADLDLAHLDAGEVSVLSMAIANPGAIVILDDHAGRAEAIRHNIPLLGTVGILLRAKQQDRIAAVGPPLAELRNAGLYVSNALSKTVLRLAGESEN